MARGYDRRGVLAGSGAAALAGAPLAGAATARDLRVVLLGQSLIQQDLRALGWPGRAALRRRFAGADVVFTDLETAIEGPLAGAPTRDSEVLHHAPPSVIDCLREVGVTLVTTANNHAWDLNGGGILSAVEALDRRGIVHAGSGKDLATASAAAVQRTSHGAVALVAAAAGAIRDGAAATATRPGVAELRRLASGALDPDDVARTLALIRTARAGSATVLMCLHNHYWEDDQSRTPEWQRGFARQCVDAGASAFVAHGTPLMQGMELYRGAPLFHGLGNFIFQTRKPQTYGPATWQSLIVDTRFRDGALRDLSLTPIRLDARPSSDGFTRGWPEI